MDYIITPTQVIKCEGNRTKPTGIVWSLLSRFNLRKLPILRTLYKKEKEAGNEIALKVIPRTPRAPKERMDSEGVVEEGAENEERAPRRGRGRDRGSRGNGRRGRGGIRSRRRQQSEQSGDEFKENSDPNAGKCPNVHLFKVLQFDSVMLNANVQTCVHMYVRMLPTDMRMCELQLSHPHILCLLCCCHLK